MLPQATADHYRRQQRVTVTTVAANRRAWSAMTDDFDASWRVVSPRLSLITSAGQLAAAQGGINYLPEVLAETGQIDRPAATVVARAFAGVAADGRPLDSMLYGAVTNAKQAMAQGVPPVEALARGGRWLDMATQTTIADAGRVATGVGIAIRPDVGGYTRMVNMPSCNRCIVLSGKFFRWNQGFRRHPHCDCIHLPASRDIAESFIGGPVGPDSVVDGVSTTVNPRSAGARITPERIYRRAASRDEAIDQLEANGYTKSTQISRRRPSPPTPARRISQPDERPSSALSFGSTKAERLYANTVRQLDELHRIQPDVLPTTRIVQGGKTDRKGGHFTPAARPPKPRRGSLSYQEYHDRLTEWRNSPTIPEILVNDRGDGTALFNFLHEFGHRADYTGSTGTSVGSGSMMFYSVQGTPATSAFQAAARATTPIRDAYQHSGNVGYVTYFRSPEEVWARAYSQWAANQLGGVHREALDATRLVNNWFQWSDEEFVPLSRLVEDVLRERGLL